MKNHNPDFWMRKSLAEMNRTEWDALCDGCGRCCMNKLEDEDTGEVFFTDVACKLLNLNTCRCKDFEHRVDKVPDCLVLDMDHPEYFQFLPNSCAYRRLYEGLPLLDWHPLVSGNPRSVHQARISMRRKCVSEEHIHADELQHRIIEFAPV